jgi:hypothetical protein
MLPLLEDTPKPACDGTAAWAYRMDVWVYGEGNSRYNEENKHIEVRCYFCLNWGWGGCGGSEVIPGLRDNKLHHRPYYWICKVCQPAIDRVKLQKLIESIDASNEVEAR